MAKIQSSEHAKALANKRWADRASRPSSVQVQVTLPADLVAAMDASGKKRSKLIEELLRAWANQSA